MPSRPNEIQIDFDISSKCFEPSNGSLELRSRIESSSCTIGFLRARGLNSILHCFKVESNNLLDVQMFYY